jgi:KDO2-lipid IV(A) lauroyltransferase
VIRHLRHLLEAAAFFAIIGVFRLFSLDRASAIGGWIGRTLAAPMRFSRRARSNLSLAFPEKTPSEIDAIVRAMWDNLGRVMAEYAHLDRIHLNGPDARIEGCGAENFEAARAKGKGVILISVRRWLERVRSRNGMPEQIAKGTSGMWRTFALLRGGQAALLLVDQRASEGLPIPFFGRDAFTTLVPAALALKLGTPVVPVSNRRVDGARFFVTVHPEIEPPNTGDPNRDLVEFTAAITRFIEDRVRERPHEWLWIHKRWVSGNAPLAPRAQVISSSYGQTAGLEADR